MQLNISTLIDETPSLIDCGKIRRFILTRAMIVGYFHIAGLIIGMLTDDR
jgi:hypothetical protein